MTFDESFDSKNINLAFEFTSHNVVELYSDGRQEDFS